MLKEALTLSRETTYNNRYLLLGLAIVSIGFDFYKGYSVVQVIANFVGGAIGISIGLIAVSWLTVLLRQLSERE